MFKTVNNVQDISHSWEGNLLLTAIRVMKKPDETEEEVLQALIQKVEEEKEPPHPLVRLTLQQVAASGEERTVIDRIHRQFHYAPGLKKAVYDKERLRMLIELIKNLLYEQLKEKPGVFFVVSYSYTWNMPSLAIEEGGKVPEEEALKKMVEHIKFALRYYGYEYVTETLRNPFYVLYFRELK